MLDLLKHLSKLLRVLLKGSVIHDDVVSIQELGVPGHASQYFPNLYQSLECSWGIAETKAHHLAKLVQPSWYAEYIIIYACLVSPT